MARILIVILRIALLIVLIYYFIKLLGRWLVSGTKGERVEGSGGTDSNEKYRKLTDQVIDDADFEDIAEEEEEGE